MKVFSMFSGIGGFEKGILEIDNSVEFIGLPDIDMICGGFPCQSFSIAGKRGGIEYDTRGTLFREIIRIAESKRPKIILLENVKGLLSSQEGWDFYVIQDSLVQCGYQLEWQVFNTKDFIPQNRERVFIIGYFGKECKEKIFPIWKSNTKYNKKGLQQAKDNIAGCINAKNNSPQWQFDSGTTLICDSGLHRKKQKKDIVAPLRSNTGCSHNNILIADYRIDEGLRIRKDNNSPTLNADCHRDHNTNKHLTKCPPLLIQPVLTPNRKEKRQDGRRFKDHNEDMFTLTGQDQHGIKVNSKIRRLTPIECERLQGFPDNYTKYGIDKDGKKVEISDTQRYKVLGNAVSIPVISFIYKRLKKCFDI
jgi:DNA (cytosine-5)-methyltransferase 1